MKIKRKEYDKLVSDSKRLDEILHLWFVVRSQASDGTQPELVRVPLVSYAEMHAIVSDQPWTVAADWIKGPVQFEFIYDWNMTRVKNMADEAMSVWPRHTSTSTLPEGH